MVHLPCSGQIMSFGLRLQHCLKYFHVAFESCRDGSNDNFSWNCGTEGETSDQGILGLREKQMKNMLVALFISQGTPMILAGKQTKFSSEHGTSQGITHISSNVLVSRCTEQLIWKLSSVMYFYKVMNLVIHGTGTTIGMVMTQRWPISFGTNQNHHLLPILWTLHQSSSDFERVIPCWDKESFSGIVLVMLPEVNSLEHVMEICFTWSAERCIEKIFESGLEMWRGMNPTGMMKKVDS